MRFDNSGFQQKTKETIAALNDLEANLKMDKATGGLDKIKNVLSSFSFTPVTQGAEAAASGFTNMSIAGVTVIQELTRKVVDLGLSITQNLGNKLFGPMMEGFGEYQTQMGAVQTVLTNTADKGTTLKDVNKAFSELNTYADKTIYNFAEMTRNIGTFTAAGVDLDKATTSIKGIANLAAGSGSTSQQASVAMYQLSQAIAAGSLKLQDWNSVVNAGMGGQLFQKELQKTAESYGVNVDAIIKKAGSFRESLSEGWITSDILTETLSRFADESTDIGKRLTSAATEVKTVGELFGSMGESIGSGWARLWQIIIGDYDEAKIVLTEIFNTFDKVVGGMFEGIINTAESWKQLGGRTKLIDALRTAIKNLYRIVETIKNAFRVIIPPITGKTLYDLTLKFENFAKNLEISSPQMIRLSSITKGVTSIFLLFKQAITGITTVIKPFESLFSDLALSLADIGKRIDMFRQSNVVLDSMNQVWSKLGSLVSGIVKAFQEVFPIVTDAAGGLSKVQTVIANIIAKISALITIVQKPLTTIFKGLFSIYSILFNIIGSFIRAISKATFINTIAGWITNLVAKLSVFFIKIDQSAKKNDTFFKIFDKIVQFLNGSVSVLDAIFSGLTKNVNTFFNAFKRSTGIDIPGIFGKLTGAFSKLFSVIGNGILNFDIGTAFDELVSKINSFTKAVNNSINKYFPSKKIKDETKNIKDGTKDAEESVDPLQKILDICFGDLSKLKTVFSKIGNGLRAVGSVIGRLLKTITSNITAQNFESIAKGGFFTLLDIILTKMIFFKKSFAKGVGQLIGGDIFEKFKGALDKIGDIGESVTKVMDQLSNTLQAYQTKLNAEALKNIAIAVAILAASLLILSLIDASKLTASSVAMAELFAELVGSLALLIKATKSAQAVDVPVICASMIELAAAVLIMSIALKMISKLDPTGVKNGVVAIEALIGGMVIAAKQLNELQGGLKSSVSGLLKLSIAVIVLALAVKMLSSIDPELLDNSLLAVEALLGSLVLSAKVLSSLNGGMKQATSGMLKLVIAVLILAVAMKSVSKIDPDTLGSSFLVIVGLISALVAAAKILASNSKGFTSAAIGLVILSFAVTVLAKALATVSILPAESIAISVLAISLIIYVMMDILKQVGKNVNGGAAAAVIAFGYAINSIALGIQILAQLPIKNMVIAALAMVVLITVLAEALSKLSSMSGNVIDAASIFVSLKVVAEAMATISVFKPEAIAVSTIALVALVGALVLFTKSVNPGQMSATAVAMSIMSVALIGMATALLIMSKAGLMGAIIGIGAMIGIFGALAIGMRLIRPVISVMYSFSGALVTMGVGLTLISVAILLFTVAFTTLATTFSTVGIVFFENLKTAILEFMTMQEEIIMAKLSTWAAMVPILIETIFIILSQSVEKILEPLLKMLLNILETLKEYVPEIVEAILDLLIAIFDVLIEDEKTKKLIEDITEFLMQTLEGLLEGLTEEIPTLVHDLFEFIATFLESLHTELSTNGERIARSISDIIGDLIDMAIAAIEELFGRLADTGYKIGEKIGSGLVDAGDWLKEKVVEPIKNGHEEIKKKFNDFLEAGKKIINKIVEGIKKIGGNIKSKVQEYINKAIDWINGLPEKLKESGKNFIQGFINGIVDFASGIKEKIESIGNNIVNWWNKAIGNASPSKKAKKSAKFYFQGFINGTSEMTKDVLNSVSNIGTAVVSSMDEIGSMSAKYSVMPDIVPIIDMEGAKSNLQSLSSAFDNMQTIFDGMIFNVPDIHIESDVNRVLNVNNSDILKALAELNNRIDILSDYLSSTAIYLDKNTLVGELVSPLNSQFGLMASHTRRGKL